MPGEGPEGEVREERLCEAEAEEEEVLQDDGLLGEDAEGDAVWVGGGVLLDACPGEVDVEEEEEDA